MGCFSFKCKESGKPVASSSFDGDAVRLYLLKDGKVIEEMVGHYDSYGRVFGTEKEPNDTSMTETTSYEWKTPWGEVCDLMFNPNESNGIAAVLECYFTGEIPTTRSDDDRDQGWGENNGKGVVIKEPYHKVY
jgi:hypothetical protein